MGRRASRVRLSLLARHQNFRGRGPLPQSRLERQGYTAFCCG